MSWEAKEYWIFCDESVAKGDLFSNFFGGAILPASSHSSIENRLRIAKAEIGFIKELKWQRVSAHWVEGYMLMMTAFFDLLRADEVRMRIMFRDNAHSTEHLTEEQHGTSYFRLYYQFIKHAFGLAYIPHREGAPRLRLFFDQFPDTGEQVAQFKGFLGAMPRAAEMRRARLELDPSHITEINSKEHVLLQCVDIILGAMAFRLNDMHKCKPEGQRQRGKRTVAKDKLYRHILAEIRTLKPGFNPKCSTGTEPYPEGRWSMPYRHWSFTPRNTSDQTKKMHSFEST